MERGELETFDVAVVGGGPAGSAAALGLAQRGWRVVVLERHPLPRYKTCGGGVVGRAVRLLPPGMTSCVERECHAAELRLARDGLQFRVARPAPLVSMYMRAQLDAALLDAARRAGAEVRAPCRVLELERRADAVELATSRGPLAARFVVAADGVASRIAAAAGWTRPLDTLPALECEVDVGPATLQRFADAARFEFGVLRHGYAWVFPKRDHLSIGVLCTRRGPARLREALDRYMRALGIDDIQNLELHGALIPAGPRAEPLGRDRVLLVGDAAGLADPVTCEGITFALHSGRLAAESLHVTGLDSSRAATCYDTAIQAEILPELRLARRLAAFLYGESWLQRALFRRHGAALCEAMADVILGTRTYGSLLRAPRSYLALARAGPRVRQTTRQGA